MKLEQQVCSLELSKKLKELEVKQESLWWWVPLWGAEKIETYKLYLHRLYAEPDTKDSPDYSAFTTSELGEMLPNYVKGNEIQYSKDTDNNFWVQIIGIDNETIKHFKANTEANARAKMLIYLLENKLIEV